MYVLTQYMYSERSKHAIVVEVIRDGQNFHNEKLRIKKLFA